MTSGDVDLCQYDIHLAGAPVRYDPLGRFITNLNVSLVLDFASDWPVARCPVLLSPNGDIDGERYYVDLQFPETDREDDIVRACFSDGYWQPVKSDPIHVDGVEAITGYLYRSPAAA
jgi:hypothetical protein